MQATRRFWRAHEQLTRRYFLALGAAGAAAAGLLPAAERDIAPELQEAIARLESFFTLPENFRDVSRGKPLPHSLPPEKMTEVGLTRETWKLDVLADPEQPAKLRKPMTKEAGTALDFAGLLALSEKHAVRFAKVMTCLNIGCPLGMGIWEGVPLREVIWRTQPTENLRRVVYYGYHNDDEKQMFKSSLPVGRVLEDPFDLPPVILCYKLNGQFLSPQRGGPVRMVIPEAYGFKNVKWLSHVLLTNLAYANDTYIGGNNDIDSPLKSFSATPNLTRELPANRPIPVTGYAQVGVSGVSKVQVWIQPEGEEWPSDDPNFTKAPWIDAEILAPPAKWGGGLEGDKIPAGTIGFAADGQPKTWPMRLAKIHWAALLPGLPAGDYTLRSRVIDDKGHAQPMPRPFRKSGHAAIEAVEISVK